MSDIWSFLLQTLTASGAAALLLVVKMMFRDKLSPQWQFAVWGVLALILVLPAGFGGRYALLNWPLFVEVIRSAVTGDFGVLTRVTAPVPLPPPAVPESAADWLYLIYVAGAVVLLARYLASYFCLRLALRRGRRVPAEQVRAVAEAYHLPSCPAVEVDGLPAALVCGVFRPVLTLPAGAETDGKVILHELLHLKYRDVVWGLVIAFFRCLHWCNPLLWLCADWAGSDLESLCDQRVLERLEGEEHRDYGRVLLSMADEKHARVPGTSAAANGEKSIRRRVEAIARFKRYPAEMGLISMCITLVLVVPLLVGTRAEEPIQRLTGHSNLVMASARTTWCTTCAGAFDAYAKAMLTGEIPYRAMCAPLSEQNELAEACRDGSPYNMSWLWSRAGNVRSWPDSQQGYEIYNLRPTEDGGYEGLLALMLNYIPDDEVEWADWSGTTSTRWMAIQPLRAEKEGDRWVIIPLDDMRAVQGDRRSGGNIALPAWVYEAQYEDFTIRLQWQTTTSVRSSYTQSSNTFWSFPIFETAPKPHGEFDQAERSYILYALYTGSEADRERYSEIRVEYAPVYNSQGDRPDRPKVTSEVTRWGDRDLKEYWAERSEDWIFLVGGGGGYEGGAEGEYLFPSSYDARLYLNGQTVKLTLLPVEGGEWLAN